MYITELLNCCSKFILSESVNLAVMGFISPGIGFLKSWQGIVELVLRAVAIVRTLTYFDTQLWFSVLCCGYN